MFRRLEVSRHFSWLEPHRYLLSVNDIEVRTAVEGGTVKLACRKFPVEGLLAYIDSEHGEEADWEDNMYDLMPGETVSLNVKGLNGRPVKTRWLYSWEEGLKPR